MYNITTNDDEGQVTEITRSLDQLAREEARGMILAALELEVEQYVQSLRHLRDEQAHAMVVRNGKARQRTVQLGAGPIKVKAPRANDRRADQRFTSKILPPYMRRSPCLEEALPVLYLRGLSTGDFSEALEALLGPEATGFSASTITRLLKAWQKEYAIWHKRSLEGKEYIYTWADGVYFGVRLEEDRLACLVIMGVLPDGRKEVIAIEDGYRESTESWTTVLRDLKPRGSCAMPFNSTRCTESQSEAMPPALPYHPPADHILIPTQLSVLSSRRATYHSLSHAWVTTVNQERKGVIHVSEFSDFLAERF